jgi:hypothetical protein
VNVRTVAEDALSFEAIDRFVAGSGEIRFEAKDRLQLYGWVKQVLIEQEYAQQGKVVRSMLVNKKGRHQPQTHLLRIFRSPARRNHQRFLL